MEKIQTKKSKLENCPDCQGSLVKPDFTDDFDYFCDDCSQVFKIESESENDSEKEFQEGDFLYASWGYDQTNIDFVKIIEVSSTRKTVVCKMTEVETAETGKQTKGLVPTGETYGDKFRLYVRWSNDGRVKFRGSYPFCNGTEEQGTRMGTFFMFEGDPKHETMSQYGH